MTPRTLAIVTPKIWRSHIELREGDRGGAAVAFLRATRTAKVVETGGERWVIEREEGKRRLPAQVVDEAGNILARWDRGGEESRLEVAGDRAYRYVRPSRERDWVFQDDEGRPLVRIGYRETVIDRRGSVVIEDPTALASSSALLLAVAGVDRETQRNAHNSTSYVPPTA